MDESARSQHLQRALNGLRQLSTSLRSASGSLGGAVVAANGQSGSDGAAGNPSDSAVGDGYHNSDAGHVRCASRNDEYHQPVERFRQQLNAGGSIDLANLRHFAVHGVPDGRSGLRAVAWKLLLGYLPPDQRQWGATLRSKRAEYARFCKDLIINPNGIGGSGSSSSAAEQEKEASPDPLNGAAWSVAVSADDHPLSTESGSKWREFFKDNEVLEQIERDVMRTHPDMHFFSGDDAAATQHRSEMCRALFIFAKLNPGLTYVQGMNELYAPLYYLCAHDSNGDAAQHAEADAWYMFVDLISDFRDNFCKQLDNSNVGIKSALSRLSALLKAHDRELWYHLEVKTQVNPQFYAFRWITLLLTQEFSFPDAMRLWDTLLADSAGRADCLLRLCLAMLMHVREELLSGDFGANMKLLQSFPSIDVNVVLQRAEKLRRSHFW